MPNNTITLPLSGQLPTGPAPKVALPLRLSEAGDLPEEATARGTVHPAIVAAVGQEIHTRTAETRQPFVIDTEEKAVWCLRKMKANRDEIDAIKAATAQRIEELEADYRAMLSKWAQPLESWATGEAERRRRQTVTLPLAGCSLRFRTVPGKLVEKDSEGPARAEIAQALGFMTEPVLPAPDLRKLSEHARAHFKETGEILPGYEFKDPEKAFKIDFSAKGGDSPGEE